MSKKEEQILEELFNIGSEKEIKEKSTHPCIETQFPTINDYILGIGGFPRGRMVEISAEENCGKTSFLLNCVGYWQKKGYKIAYAAAEPVDYSWAQHCGVDTRNAKQGCTNPIYWMDKEKGVTNSNDYAAKMKTIIAMDYFDIIITDSMGAVNPPEMVTSDSQLSMYDNQANPKFWGIFLRQLEGGFVGYHDGKPIKNPKPILEWKMGKSEENDEIHKLEQKKCCFILVNHLKQGVGQWASKYTSGGKNKDFRFSHRIWLSIAKTVKGKEKGVEVVKERDIKFLLKKGKLGSPTGRNMLVKFIDGIFSEIGGSTGFQQVKNEDDNSPEE